MSVFNNCYCQVEKETQVETPGQKEKKSWYCTTAIEMGFPKELQFWIYTTQQDLIFRQQLPAYKVIKLLIPAPAIYSSKA